MSWPTPTDGAVVRRMRHAHDLACKLMGTRPLLRGREAWGWRGRTLGRPVMTGGLAWLRVASASTDQLVDLFWNGNVEAEARLPRSIPRPRLRAWHDWGD